MLSTKSGKHQRNANPQRQAFQRINPVGSVILVSLLLVAVLSIQAQAEIVTKWDFTKDSQGWRANQYVENFKSTNSGLVFQSTGLDPWIEGPPINLRGSRLTRVRVRMKSDADSAGELFYGRNFNAEDSVRFTVHPDGKWHEYTLMIDKMLGRDIRFRLDPSASEGDITVASIQVETLDLIEAPKPDKPVRPNKGPDKPLHIRSQTVELVHYGRRWGDFIVIVDGTEMASGYDSETIGIMLNDRPHWLNLKTAKVKVTSESETTIAVRATLTDSEGGDWRLIRRFTSSANAGTIIVETQLKADTDRDLVYVPYLTIFPGLGTYGQKKYQGLFAGVEYLSDEPSSSKADIEIPAYIRRTPDPLKITFPLMSISHDSKYVGLMWEPSETVAATFDSPDRIYNSQAHVMSLSGPGVGSLRFENEFCAHTPIRLKANEPLKATATIIAGQGKTVVDAVKHYVRLKEMPPLPRFEGGFESAIDLLSHGWLDSQANRDGLFRHAVWGTSFPPVPAADAVTYIDWLANHTKNENLAARLRAAESQALEKIPANQPYSSSVSHANLPSAPLMYGRIEKFVRLREGMARNLLGGFDNDGVKLYRPGNVDYSRTHFAKHANGLAGRDMVAILEGATLSGDKTLIRDALALLDKQTALYANTVPRGAQTWEVPLHTPDILASAHMVKAYTLGYIISGRREYLEQARYWAWTGVPFIYLYNPTSGQVGPYSTIAVLGATNWRAPLWLGQPVQWCGLVYGSALHLLAQNDPQSPWENIAKAITVTGLQMTWSLSDTERQGLLPDYFDLRAQISLGPAINPGTVQAHLPELYGKGTLYSVKKLPAHGWFVHAPCTITDVRDQADQVAFTAAGWKNKPYYVLLSGVDSVSRNVVVSNTNDPPGDSSTAHKIECRNGLLIIQLNGKSRVNIR